MKKIIMVLCLLFALCIDVSASNSQIDLQQKGSIHITLNDPKTSQPIQNGSFTFYKVADIVVKDGKYQYTYTNDFSKANVSLDHLQSSNLIQYLVSYVKANKVACYTVEVDHGSVKYDHLPIGLYLVTNSVLMEGYNEVSPFLVSIPNKMNNEYNYNVEATPKMSITTKPTTPPKPPQEIPPVIPVTGVLWWPVPVLSVLGLLLISVGYIKKFKYEKNI